MDKIIRERRQTLAKVIAAIKRGFGDQYNVECYGSTIYGLDTPTSDLDLVIIV